MRWVAISFSEESSQPNDWTLSSALVGEFFTTEHQESPYKIICILSLCLFNFYAEYIMRNAGLEETQAGNKIAGRNINNLSYADDTTLMAESEDLKSLLKKVK